MSERVALCLAEDMCRNPETIGLDGEVLDAQDWLEVYLDGQNAREAIKSDASIREAWVISCDDVEPINLAAALKSDRPDLCVRLVTSDGCGSLYSRAHTALIDEVLELRGFVKRYVKAKRLALRSALSEDVQSDSPAGQASSAELSVGLALQPESTVALRSGSHVSQSAHPDSRSRSQSSPLAAHAQRKGFVMPIVSGSGGAGKSSVSTVSALIASRRGLRTLLLDYDLQFGDIACLSGAKNPLPVDEALSHPEKLEREVEKGGALTVISAPKRLETAEEIAQGLPELLDWLAKRFDVIVANTGAAWAEYHAVLLERSSATLFLVDQRMSSVRSCNHALELCARCGIATGSFRFVLNRCAKGAPLSSLDVSNILQGVSVLELKEGGRDVEDCLSGGAALDLLDSNNDFVASVGNLLDQVLPFSAYSDAESNGGDEYPKVVKRRGRHAGRRRGRRS